MSDVEQLTGPCAHHGEGPVWAEEWGGLRWVDMLAGDVLALDPSGQVIRQHVDEVAAVVRPRAGGGMAVGVSRGFALVDADGRVTVLPPFLPPGTRMNEGACDPQGRFYAGSMAYDAAPGRGALYRLSPGGAVDTVLEGVTISNGLAWSPDGATAYYVDTPTGRVDAFDHDPEAGLSGRRPAVIVDERYGSPDGLTVDAEGFLWVALWGGGAVHRYTPDGRLDGRIELPAAQVTACAFGGDDLGDLYVTTSRFGMDEPEPGAGALFRVRPGVFGLPTAAYAG
ncbi:sugar lactone lactonase YvrE [Thermocatellispora tengchongensis]|uniref:Sugar lactone lactonase YvrE n=1 Tax=Thermocatellispora tengchongensis TaxID=1073253 RepID=A0A840PR04_9ACTN|nr:SMP-30/gluconolactonase/LRE family protein [Thermocatellispora tengchongensis]MBB5140543.1 sugar lactone lactonase YvrE [Thermocatellispora tengchongensis]